MADQHVHQNSAGNAAWLWAIIVLILVGVIAWFVIGSGARTAPADGGVNIDVNVPAAPAGGGAGDGAGGAGGRQ